MQTRTWPGVYVGAQIRGIWYSLVRTKYQNSAREQACETRIYRRG